MSRLRELRLHGFKSFADPTRFLFEPGVNAVLGPNGSGKSNMADAVRWVLGEQSNRSLRTRRADDVIFAGSEGRRPQGMAEVILTLDNADGWLPIEFAEVSVGRRAYRSGESEYLINGARARLRDITELLGAGSLGANELVVVGQGTVDAALSLRPEERRQLFEEAAGVKGLQVKRNEAAARLAKALDNLARVSDLIGELKPQVRRFAMQAEHQQQHDTLASRARALVVASHRRRAQVARAALGDARRAAAAAEAGLESYRVAEAAGRQAIVAAEAAYWEADEAARLRAQERQVTREELIRAEGRLEAAEARVREVELRRDREAVELKEAVAALTSDVPADGDVELAAALQRSAMAEDGWRAALASLAEADEALLQAEEAVAQLRAREGDRIAAAARLEEDRARRASRHEQAREERERLEGEVSAARAELGAADEALHAAALAREAAGASALSAEQERDTAQARSDDVAHRQLAATERVRALRAELDAIANATDTRDSLSRRLAGSGWRAVVEAMAAPEDAWAAVEAVVGGELEAALLWSTGDPAADLPGARGTARLLLAADGAGGDDVAREDALRAVGAERTLADWVATPDAPALFRRTAVAPSVGHLLRGWRALPAGWSAVTPEGDLADARGVVVLRGRADPPGGAAARAHARRRDLEDALRRAEAEVAGAQLEAHAALEALRTARDRHLSAREAEDAAEAELRASRDRRSAADGTLGRLLERTAALDAELAALGPAPTDGGPIDAADATLAERLDALQSQAQAARVQRDARAAERDAARDEWAAARAAAQELETLTVDGRRDRAAREARVAQLRASIPVLQAAIDTALAERDALGAAVLEARTRDARAAALVDAAERARGERRAALVEVERSQSAAGARLAELERAAQSTAIEASRRDEALSALMRERDLALDALPAAPEDVQLEDVDGLDDETIEAELRRVRRTLGQIGSVNPFAVEEHREVAGRLEEMTAQDTDLRGAIDSTQELIRRLDVEIAERFQAAFRAIGERFNEYCGLLFAGGSGSLTTSDAEDGEAPGGIEIVVRPPGKRLQRLGMLSGGERALTGVALLFAMLTVNPVPFCILDEVDAALDEANIGRFASALRRLSESIDFVVITHNRATIEVADTIYGVTMTDAAVSRVLSLRLADVPAAVVA